MASDREQFRVLVKSGDVKVADVSQALLAAGIAPDLSRWRAFIDNMLLWLGGSSMAAGVLFFIAYNWEMMGRFAKFGLVQSLMVVALACYVFFRKNERIGNVSLFVASILLGVLLALFGQTYQTGADPWQLFATWAVLMLPWTLIARFAPLWLMFAGLLNVAWLLYVSVFRPDLGAFATSAQTKWLGVAALNGVALILWEWRMSRHPWLQNEWSPRLLALSLGVAVTMLAVMVIVWSGGRGGPFYLLLWLAVTVAGVGYYRYRRPDLFMLAGVCFSSGAVVLTFLGDAVMGKVSGGGEFLFMAVVVIAMGTGAAVWLRRTQKALFEEAQ